MDLKSMLNDSAAQRQPALHTHQSSYDARASERSAQDVPHSKPHSHSHSQSHLNRPMPYPPPLQPVDSRPQSTGGYFGLQSPHPSQVNSVSTHASTPSAGPHSAYARSPGGQSQSYTPREGSGPQAAYNTSFVPSPSLSVNQPPTPGSVHQHQSHTPSSAHSQSGHPHAFAHAQSPRGSQVPNGQPQQLSPNAPHPYPQPVTPLGPPINYNKVSPQLQRPSSQGIDQHYRKTSYGSVGSLPGREHSIGSQPPPDHSRSESIQRQSIPELERLKERDRSVSVSPKTIPQPSPYRQTSTSSQPGSLGRPSVRSSSEQRAMSNISDVQVAGNVNAVEVKSEYQQTPTPRTSALPGEQQSLSRGQSVKQETPEFASSPAPQNTLKRNASFMSDQSQSSQMQPRKRLRRNEIPIFAQSARQKPLRLGKGGPKIRPNKPVERPAGQLVERSVERPVAQPAPPTPQQLPKSGPPPPAPSMNGNGNGNGNPNGNGAAPTAVEPMSNDVAWESSIANITPYEDLTRRVCNWIYEKIGLAVPPSGGAMFEIEAKIGEIHDVEAGSRVRLPVSTEAVFLKEEWPHRTRFESSMNMEQHMLLNKYLNDLTREAFLQAQKGERHEIFYNHPHEVDEFFELTPEGKANLNPSILEYLSGHHKARVRRTRDRNTGQLKAQIIKTRIADLEIFNPNTDFDCRISISIESPWEGSPNWLVPMRDFEGRHKDRMSYRHMAYQVDLTQVSHDNKPDMEHELEVEISTEQIRRELDNLQNQRPSKYEELVKGLLDNVRLLCRKGTVPPQRRG